MPALPLTTASLLTPPGKGGIAVIALRGPGTADVLKRLFRPLPSHAAGCHGSAAATRVQPPNSTPCEQGVPPVGRLQLGRLFSGDRILDEAVVHHCGDWAEINIHGGPAVTRAVLEALVHCGVKIEPSDVSSVPVRASHSRETPYGVTTNAPALDDLPPAHPRWDNPAVGRELLAVLPQAASATVVAALAAQWSAGISELARGVLASLGTLGATAAPYAAVHPQPGNLEWRMPNGEVRSQRGGDPACASSLQTSTFLVRYSTFLRNAANGLSVMRRLLSPAEVVLAGPPNAGKSTLANALVGRVVSIVHETPGTTRDWVRELATLDGLPVWITDTAGLGSGMGVPPLRPAGILPADNRLRAHVEDQSARRAVERITRADVVLLLGQPPADLPPAMAGSAKVIPVWPKSDLRPAGGKPPASTEIIVVSAHTGEGMDLLRSVILRAIGLADFDPAVPRAFTERQASLLSAAAAAFERGEATDAASNLERLLAEFQGEN